MSQSVQPAGNPSLQTRTQTSRDSSTVRIPGTLRLRGDETPNANEPSPRRIRWSEDVVDNEGMGKKSSKVCCIYHKARPVGESSSESESDSSSSDSESDDETRRRHRANHAHHAHPREQPCGGESSDKPSNQSTAACCSGSGSDHKHSKPKRKPSPNAYEKMPKSSKNPSQGT